MKIIEEKDRFALYNDADQEIGEMTFIFVGETMVINHTYVESAYRGQKLAEQLVKAGVDKARREHIKIYPTCPFAVKEFARKPEYGDVYQDRLKMK
jgi:predicted GNAT family acetyltransferase